MNPTTVFWLWLAGTVVAWLPAARFALLWEERDSSYVDDGDRMLALFSGLIIAMGWPLAVVLSPFVLLLRVVVRSRFMKTPRELEQEREEELREREQRVAEAERTLRDAGVRFEIGDEK